MRGRRDRIIGQAEYKRMMEKVGEVSSAHYTFWTRAAESNPMVKVEEVWFRPGASRKVEYSWRNSWSGPAREDRLVIKEDSWLKSYMYDADKSRVIKSNLPPTMSNAFNLGLLIKGYVYCKEGLIVGEGTFGPEGMTITAHCDNYARYVFLVDPKTHLPLEAEFQRQESGSWYTYLRLDFDYQGPFDNKFDPADLVPKR